MSTIEAVIAKALLLDEDQVNDELAYQAVPQWDSLRHVALMLALERALGVEVDGELRVRLSSVRAIREFINERAAGAVPIRLADSGPRAPSPVIHRGLDGVHVDNSHITRIDGANGRLEYRGYSIHDLARHAIFEETAYLLIHGDLPDAVELADFEAELARSRSVPAPVLGLMRTLAQAHPMEALRTGISALGAFESDCTAGSPAGCLRQGIRLIAQVPILVAAHHAAREKRELMAPPAGLSHAAYFLHLLRGTSPSPTAVRLIDRDLIVHADHSSNASAFAARVVIGCRAGMHAAITAAVGAFSGELHGGAAERVLDLIDDIGVPERASGYIAERLARNESVMGFGHRVYRTEDPRVCHMREAALQASHEHGDLSGYEILAAVVDAMKPYARHGVDANVDLYASLVYRMLDLPRDLAVPIFVAGRMAGWVAQALEQVNNNVLIRPLLNYVGATGRSYPHHGGAR